jgi:putative membrane protein
MPTPPEQDSRVYFAAERTFLAWIRTGLGLMGVGFAVSRFGLFLREFSATQSQPQHIPTAHSVAAGVALVALGVLVTVAATIQHFTLVRQLAAGTWQAGHVSRTAVALAVLLAILGAGMAIYLVRIH